jgi:uncharacterized repeat protein (TIGR03803 family)
MTSTGGTIGDGTVFEIVKTASGYASTPTTLVNFNNSNGDAPTGNLIADVNGNLFGTTLLGGAYSDGTVFEITNAGFVLLGDQPPTIDSADTIFAGLLSELNKTTGSDAVDYANNRNAKTPSGVIAFTDADPSSRPTALIDTAHETVTYENSTGHTFSLTPAQTAAFEAALSIAPEAGNINNGKIDWTYKITDSTLDFLGVGETVKVTAPVQINDGTVEPLYKTLSSLSRERTTIP